MNEETGKGCCGSRAEALSTDVLLMSMYDDLRRLAARRLAAYPSGTLSPTALVHEAYLRLTSSASNPVWNSDRHFFSAAAEGMWRVLVEDARRQRTVKRGGHLERVELLDWNVPAPSVQVELLDVREALAALECVDHNAAQLVVLRYYSGLSLREAADVLGLSLRTANRRWAYARNWLYKQLSA